MDSTQSFNAYFYSKWLLIPLIIFCISCVLFAGQLLTSDLSATVLSYFHTQSKIKLEENQQSQTIRGAFAAKKNNLGVIVLEFEQGSLPQNGEIIFKVKEVGATKWWSKNTYNVQQFFSVNPYPFGFPIISDSENKVYTFEIQTLDTSQSLKLQHENFYTKYKFSSTELINRPSLLLDFAFTKVLFALNHPIFIRYATVSFSPLFIYYLCILLYSCPALKEKIKQYQHEIVSHTKVKHLMQFMSVANLALFALTLVEILVLASIYAPLHIFLFTWWTIQATKRGAHSYIFYALATICTVALLLMLALQLPLEANAAATWIFYFMMIGAVKSILEDARAVYKK